MSMEDVLAQMAGRKRPDTTPGGVPVLKGVGDERVVRCASLEDASQAYYKALKEFEDLQGEACAMADRLTDARQRMMNAQHAVALRVIFDNTGTWDPKVVMHHHEDDDPTSCDDSTTGMGMGLYI